MENIYVVSHSLVDEMQLRRLVEQLGGYWNAGTVRNEGVIEERDGRIFVSLASDFRSEYDSEDLDVVRRLLGSEPESAIDIHIGHSAESWILAEVFARTVIDLWGGVVDRDS